jgi:hypothetical protein
MVALLGNARAIISGDAAEVRGEVWERDLSDMWKILTEFRCSSTIRALFLTLGAAALIPSLLITLRPVFRVTCTHTRSPKNCKLENTTARKGREEALF